MGCYQYLVLPKSGVKLTTHKGKDNIKENIVNVSKSTYNDKVFVLCLDNTHSLHLNSCSMLLPILRKHVLDS